MRGVRYPQRVYGKIVGWYWPTDSVYEKVVDYEKHHSYKMGGWGIQTSLVQHLKKLGCKHVMMHVTNEGHKYDLLTYFSNYLKHGEPEILNPADGPQIFLRDEFWRAK